MTQQPFSIVPGFAERLRRLLRADARRSGSGRGDPQTDLGEVVSSAVDTDDLALARVVATAWLRAAVSGEQAPVLERDRPALQALADHFRVPIDYFLEPSVAADFDERMRIAAAASAARVLVIGPCRGLARDEDALKIYGQAIDSLAAHAGMS